MKFKKIVLLYVLHFYLALKEISHKNLGMIIGLIPIATTTYQA